ncbi:S8 family serine peptidase [Planctomycetota bacterium]|nr:S8 family serine peptidase [Planctomycetota bacterium]
MQRGTLLTGVGLTAATLGLYAGLQCFLPGASAPLASTAAPAAAAEHATAGELGGHDDHDHVGEACESEGGCDGCGLGAKALLGRFTEALMAEPGATHDTYAYKGEVLAVADQLVAGVTGDLTAAQDLAARHGLTLLRFQPAAELALLELPADHDLEFDAALSAVDADTTTTFAEPNFVARVALTPNDPFFSQMPGRSAADVELAWDVTTGDPNVIVAVLDTGMDTTHVDLVNQLVPGFDFVNNTAVIRDDNGHGTAMAGIIAAEGQNAAGVVGVAFSSRMMPVKVADAQGNASVADVVAGIDFAIAQGVEVINLSMGTRIGTQALLDAVNRARAAGIVVVASAGNDPVHYSMFPAAYPGVVAVTTTGASGEIGFECVIADTVDAAAPGEELITTLPGDVYGFVSGTSAAAAFTSGVAALVKARDPALTGQQIEEILKDAQTPIAAFAGLESTYRFGTLNARTAVDRADAALIDVAITDFRIYPDNPTANTPFTAVLEVTNEGNVAIVNQILTLQRILNGGAVIEIAAVPVANLAVGQRVSVTVNGPGLAAGNYEFRGTARARPAEFDTTDNVLALTGRVVNAAATADVAIVSRTISPPDLTAGSVTATVVIENKGSQPATNVNLAARVQRVTSTALGQAIPQPTNLGQQTVATLPVGGQSTLTFTYPIPTPAPTEVLRLDLGLQAQPGETSVVDNRAVFDFMLGTAGPLQGLYQQSNGVDVILDAVSRVNPNIPYVPVQVFVPSKGGRTPATKLYFETVSMSVSDTPTGNRTLVYRDTRGASPSVYPGGLEIVDEVGNPRTGQHIRDMFADADIDMNGRHDIFRIPRVTFGVASTPATVVERYIDARVDWKHTRTLLFGFKVTRSGDTRTVLRVRFSPEAWPELPGDNHYHDVHHHTIAEWYFGSPLDIFAPRKAYGGPLQMVFESAYAMGVIDGPKESDAFGRIITTDHSSFNNRTIPSPDGADHRPPFGPQSITNNPGTTQLEAYRGVFGITAGEEVAFKQDIPLPRINKIVNSLLDMLPGLPLGAHMLLMRADHVEGPWHGGGWLKGPGNPNINVDLFPLISDLAKTNQAAQGESFAYCAHPFSGQGWREANLDEGFGLQPQFRSRDGVHDASNEFVLKGVEFFNGRGTRTLPKAQIDFNNMNPWADATFMAGEPEWDEGIWVGMLEWHRMTANTLEYAFNSDPETRFIRKIYHAGGSDAHGDFNFSTGRAATPVNLKATYNVGDETWYAVRTYCFGDTKQGATAEDRWLEAYRDGNTAVTDGPVMTLSLDADGRWDSATQRWHDASSAGENADGMIGGNGPLDGGYTALVRRGSDQPVFRYHYNSTAEYGDIASVLLYKTEAGAPNPTRSNRGKDQIVGVNTFALSGAGQDHTQALDPTREGTVTTLTAFAAGAYTSVNPDTADLAVDDYRCYTNAIYAVPYDVNVAVTNVDQGTATIPAGGVTVEFTFDISMDPGAYDVHLKALNAQGESTDNTQPELATFTGTWSDRAGVKSSVFTVTNSDAVPLYGPAYPAAGDVSFVVYMTPRDAAGNALNSIATTFSEVQLPAPPGAAPVPGTQPTTGTTAAPATAGNPAAAAAGGGGGGSGSGCAVATTQTQPWALLWLGLLGLVAFRLRRK